MAESWVNLGRACQMAYDNDKALLCHQRALEIDPTSFPALSNLCVSHTQNADPLAAVEAVQKALAINPSDNSSHESLGYANLLMHKWTPGWKQYNLGLGRSMDRKLKQYGHAPKWDGTKGQTVVLYGEQGLGDEICFTQMIPQMIKDCNLIVDTCGTLHTLFDSSFDCPVYGTRYVDDPDWLDDHHVEAKLSMCEAMELYRYKNEQFTGEPHLKANPEKQSWWKAILAQYPGKKVGIAWSAGLVDTGKKNRTLDVADLMPILSNGDTYVCLEYKDPSVEVEWLKSQGVRILDFSMYINGHKNYEDTAALVSELDHVIAPTTTIVDLCGALGKSCDVFVPTIPFWRYYGEGCWYNSVRYIRQSGSWKETVETYAKQ